MPVIAANFVTSAICRLWPATPANIGNLNSVFRKNDHAAGLAPTYSRFAIASLVSQRKLALAVKIRPTRGSMPLHRILLTISIRFAFFISSSIAGPILLSFGLNFTPAIAAQRMEQSSIPDSIAKKMMPRQISVQRQASEWKLVSMQAPTAKSGETLLTASRTSQTSDGPYTIGNGVDAPVVLVKSVPPYTEEARKADVNGIVALQCIVRKDGTVDSCKILRGLGYGLDQSAINTITTAWRFKSGSKNGVPVEVYAHIQVTFGDAPGSRSAVAALTRPPSADEVVLFANFEQNSEVAPGRGGWLVGGGARERNAGHMIGL
jgi:TonB family protein